MGGLWWEGAPVCVCVCGLAMCTCRECVRTFVACVGVHSSLWFMPMSLWLKCVCVLSLFEFYDLRIPFTIRLIFCIYI